MSKAATDRLQTSGASPQTTEPSGDAGDAPEELGADAQADFAPIEEISADPDESAADPYHRDSQHAQQAFDKAAEAAAEGDQERAVAQYLKAAKLAETAREWYLAAVSCHRVGDFLKHPKPPVDMERALRMYRRAIAAYESCGLLSEARELSYRIMCIRMRMPGEFKLRWSQRISLVLFWATAGFGYRPLRVIGTGVAIVFMYAAFYWAIDGVVAANSESPVDFWHSLYFSGITFATVGYGDYIPAPHAQMLALTEGTLGAFTMGFFVAVIAHWLSRT